MDLIEDHGSNARQFGVPLQSSGQHPLGEHLDACRRPDPPLVARLIADQIADRGSGEFGHSARCGPSRQAPGLEHHDLAVLTPRLVEQRQRHDRRLARPGRSADDRPTTLTERRPNRVESRRRSAGQEAAPRAVTADVRPVADRVALTTPSGVREGAVAPSPAAKRPACWPAAQKMGAAKPLNELDRTERATKERTSEVEASSELRVCRGTDPDRRSSGCRAAARPSSPRSSPRRCAIAPGSIPPWRLERWCPHG